MDSPIFVILILTICFLSFLVFFLVRQLKLKSGVEYATEKTPTPNKSEQHEQSSLVVNEAKALMNQGELEKAHGLLSEHITKEPHRVDLRLLQLAIFAKQDNAQSFEVAYDQLDQLNDNKAITKANQIRSRMTPSENELPVEQLIDSSKSNEKRALSGDIEQSNIDINSLESNIVDGEDDFNDGTAVLQSLELKALNKTHDDLPVLQVEVGTAHTETDLVSDFEDALEFESYEDAGEDPSSTSKDQTSTDENTVNLDDAFDDLTFEDDPTSIGPVDQSLKDEFADSDLIDKQQPEKSDQAQVVDTPEDMSNLEFDEDVDFDIETTPEEALRKLESEIFNSSLSNPIANTFSDSQQNDALNDEKLDLDQQAPVQSDDDIEITSKEHIEPTSDIDNNTIEFEFDNSYEGSDSVSHDTENLEPIEFTPSSSYEPKQNDAEVSDDLSQEADPSAQHSDNLVEVDTNTVTFENLDGDLSFNDEALLEGSQDTIDSEGFDFDLPDSDANTLDSNLNEISQTQGASTNQVGQIDPTQIQDSPLLNELKQKFSFVNEMDDNQTNLDLAASYIDLGEFSSAKSLLEEVIDQGNLEQKTEAQRLIETLS